ncbi:DUF6677 family protein [uncultured Rubinisphaera sp.]|uniref:DUF6677 family protein n=2 Tax=Rubinisphaera TaxID=1649490 RepID=UPI0030DB829B
MSAHKPASNPETIDLKTPWLAALLSWLIPGAGQFYQRRYVKAFIFSFCILGSFFYGVALGEGRPVYSAYYEQREDQIFRKRNYGYLSQVLLGISTMPALIQSKRFEASQSDSSLDGTLNSHFEGTITGEPGQSSTVSGTIQLQKQPGMLGPEIRGTLSGSIAETGEPFAVELAEFEPGQDRLTLGPQVSANPQRKVFMRVENVTNGNLAPGSRLLGYAERPFLDWYQVPLQDEELRDLNARLGKRWELAMVFTWIAGLLNILCIWDAFEGPAYGFRPRVVQEDESKPAAT